MDLSDPADALEEILAEYDVDGRRNRRIVTPGKFEGALVFTPFYYEAAQEGDGETYDFPDGAGVIIFETTEEERAAFPELDGADYVGVEIEDNGFVSAAPMSHADVVDLEERFEAAWDDYHGDARYNEDEEGY